MVKFVATTHLRVKRDATEATVAKYQKKKKSLKGGFFFFCTHKELFILFAKLLLINQRDFRCFIFIATFDNIIWTKNTLF